MLFSISHVYISGHVSLTSLCLFYMKRVQHMFGRMWKDRNCDDRVRVEILLWGQDFLILIGGMPDSLIIDSRM